MVAPLLQVRLLAPALDLDGIGSLAFTSRNGVAAFIALTPDRSLPDWTLPVFTVGDATAEAARAAGFSDVRSASGDVEALARMLIADAPQGVILAPGAREPAADLAALVAAMPGAHPTVRALPVYETVDTSPDIPGIPSAPVDAVLFHSPRAARAFAHRTGAQARLPTPAAMPLAVALSPAVAAALPPAAFAAIHVAERPDEDALLAALMAALGKPPSRV